MQQRSTGGAGGAGAQVRVFVAVELPEGLLAALGQAQAQLRAANLPLRLVRPDGIHLTLVPLVQNLCPGSHNWQALSLADNSPKLLGSECHDNLNDFYHPPPDRRLGLFNGIDAQGEWVLSVTDGKAGNVGYLEGWGLLFTPGLTATTTLTPAAVTPILTGTMTAVPATPALTTTP